MLGCVRVCVRALLVPRDSWLGCAVWVRVLGLRFRLRPATPGWGLGWVCFGTVCAVWLGFWHAARPSWLGCWVVCVFVCELRPTPPLLAGVCGVGMWVWARVSAAPRHSWLGCWGVCVFVCVLRLYPATPGWVVRCGGLFGGSGFGCAPPILAGVLGCVCVCVRAPLVPRHSWLGCAVWGCVWGVGFRLRPVYPGGGVWVCVCLCACSVCTPPLLAWVCDMGVGVWARVPAAPRHSWLGCWGVCVFVCVLRLYPATAGLGVRCGCVCASARVLTPPRESWLGCWDVCVFVCLLRLYPATPGWGVRCGCACLGSAFGCAPLLLAGVLGCVCVCVCAPHLPRHSWLGFVVWVCVFWIGFCLRPATPGWGVWVCVCLCARSVCTPPLLARVCGVSVCAWARVLAAPRHSWLGCWVVCVFVCALCLYPATPGRDVRCGCVCLCSGFGCAPPLLAGALGCVCVCVRVSLVPRHSWLGCAVWVYVLGLSFGLRPATPGWGVGVWVCLCARSACNPPLVAGLCSVGACVWARVSAAPRHSWLVCSCAFVCALGLCPAPSGWGVWCVGWVSPGTCFCAVVRCGLCALPRFAAPGGRCCLAPVVVPWLWPAACLSGVPGGPALVRRASSGPVALSALVGFPDAVVPCPGLGAYAPGFTGRLRGARGGRPGTGLFVPTRGRCRGSGGGLARRRTRSEPRVWLVSGGSLRRRSWAACAEVVCVCGPGH